MSTMVGTQLWTMRLTRAVKGVLSSRMSRFFIHLCQQGHPSPKRVSVIAHSPASSLVRSILAQTGHISVLSYIFFLISYPKPRVLILTGRSFTRVMMTFLLYRTDGARFPIIAECTVWLNCTAVCAICSMSTTQRIWRVYKTVSPAELGITHVWASTKHTQKKKNQRLFQLDFYLCSKEESRQINMNFFGILRSIFVSIMSIYD